jgi:hypothetical protein
MGIRDRPISPGSPEFANGLTISIYYNERLAAHGLSADDIVIRMTGCPNGCARPYLAEIGLVGKGPGRYNLPGSRARCYAPRPPPRSRWRSSPPHS